MKIELNEVELLNVLGAIRKEYIESKVYYFQNVNEVDSIGVTSSEEWRKLYNNMLEQSKINVLEIIK